MERCAAHGGRAVEAVRILSSYGEHDRHRLESADWILLAGGDAVHGWRVLSETGMAAAVARRRREGAVVSGVSAGAVQLGAGTETKTETEGGGDWIDTFGWVPRVVDAHDEGAGWRRLESIVARRARAAAGPTPGLGIPFGAAVRVSTAGSAEPAIERLAGPPLFVAEPPARSEDRSESDRE